MKLGAYLGYWGVGMGGRDLLSTVQEAEQLGYDSVWTAEAYGSDAATVLAFIAAGTDRIKLGSAIFQMPARSPAMTAMTAASIDQLSGGRMLLGIGPSGPQVAEGWHGQRFARQLQRTRELQNRPGWAWTRLVRSYDEYERALDLLERERAKLDERRPTPA